MRIAVISDIHANLEALESALCDMARQEVGPIISLGDNVGYGADGEAVIQRLISEKIISVLGNHDWACVNEKVYKWYKTEIKTSLDITMANLSDSSLAYIRSCPLNLNRYGAWFVHGFPPESVRHYLHQVSPSDLEKGFARLAVPTCFVGHTHRIGLICRRGKDMRFPKPEKGITVLEENAKHIVNVGSIGQPRDGDATAKYVIWEPDAGTIEVRTVDYDNHTAARKIVAAGMPIRFARAVDPVI